MEDFCRTCGKTVNAKNCINIFSSKGRSLLHCVRTMTNCWFENISGFPIYMCGSCQSLLRKIKTFRRRCTKIESFLSKRKPKLTSSNGKLPATFHQAKINDPLRIEEPEVEIMNIKAEPTTKHITSINDNDEETNPNEETEDMDGFYNDIDETDEFERIPLGDDMTVPANVQNRDIDQLEPGQITNGSKSLKPKSGSRKYSMRVGKRTMYIKLTDDKQPKRIVDRERQWASSRPCICEHCGRQFKDSSNLNVHLLRHTGTKNYECNECNEKCYTLHLLRRHQLKHTEGPYECSFCGLQYSTKSSQVRHEREACKKGRAPQSKTELIKRGERTFHCEVCDLWFLRAGNLTQHINSTIHIANARSKSKKSQKKAFISTSET